MEAKEEEKERGRKRKEGREGQMEGGWKMRRVGEDLWPCSPGLVTCCNWPPEWDRGVWSPEIRVMEIPHFCYSYSMTSVRAQAEKKKKKKKSPKLDYCAAKYSLKGLFVKCVKEKQTSGNGYVRRGEAAHCEYLDSRCRSLIARRQWEEGSLTKPIKERRGS